MSPIRVATLAVPVLLALLVVGAVGLQMHLAIPFSAEHGPVEWLDTALLCLLAAITFGIGLFQRGKGRTTWWTAAAGLSVVILLTLGDFFPSVLPSIDAGDYPALGGWAIAVGLLLLFLRSKVASAPARLAAIIGLLFHTGALIFQLIDQYLLPRAPGMAAGFIAAQEIVELLYLGAYCCAAGLTVGRVITEAFADPAARRAGLLVPMALERLVGGWFRRPAARKLRIAIEDARWHAWKAENPNRKFSDYYVQQISRSLAAGQPHRTLGAATYSDKALLSAKDKWSAARFAARGRGKYTPLIEWGLRPDERVVDYGCGSLRVGQHLIRHLDRGNYIGLDVTDIFYKEGLQVLEPGLAEAKAPYLAVIDDMLLDRLSHNPPDVLFSVAVVMHVPPEELDGFFARMLKLAGPRTRAMIHVDVAARELRTAPKSWAYPVERYQAAIAAVRPDLRFDIALKHFKGKIDGQQWRHGIITLTPTLSRADDKASQP
jgi:hypothetical protein